MGWIGCVRCEKFQRDFVARIVAPVDPFCTECCRAKNGPKCTQIVWNAPKHEFRVQWGGSVRSLRKIPMGLLGTMFFTSLTRFTLSVVTQPNCPKCTQIVQNAPKHEVRVLYGGSSGLLRKIPTWLHGTKFFTSFTHFTLSIVTQPNCPKCTQIIRNTPKHEFRV